MPQARDVQTGLQCWELVAEPQNVVGDVGNQCPRGSAAGSRTAQQPKQPSLDFAVLTCREWWPGAGKVQQPRGNDRIGDPGLRVVGQGLAAEDPVRQRRAGTAAASCRLGSVSGHFPAKLGPKTPLNGSGSTNAVERT